jgi:hypothetical protein
MRLVTTRQFSNTNPSRIISLAWRKSFPREEAVELVSNVIRENLPPCVYPAVTHN